jgi:2,3-bisphosphoglycerate-independent phosphoglycerate mutase
VLLILDGWGYSDESDSNAILGAQTPVWSRLWRERPHMLVGTSGEAVGLPDGQMGNSEVGHLNLGAGRVVYQEFTRISRAIRTGEFFSNPAFTETIDRAIKDDKAVHILGLLSPGGVHSHEEHIHAMAQLAVERGAKQVYLHPILDGRDMPPKSALASLQALERCLAELGTGRIATLTGRYYAMDRDQRWERVQVAYDLLTQGRAEHEAADAEAALAQAYARGETDEFVAPTRIQQAGAAPVVIGDGDAVVFMNYRSDRARQITRAFVEPGFDGFVRAATPRLAGFVTLTQYHQDFDTPVAFPPVGLHNVFGEYIAALGLRQLRLAETEKYAHVTFFFNGGREAPFAGEDRILVPSPKVATYDLQPEMSAQEVTDNLVKAIEGRQYDAIICNYANPDMVGHTGQYEAAKQAVETIDRALGQILAALEAAGGEMLITADHGNAEQMWDRAADQPHTAHTHNPVPLIYVGRPARLAAQGSLCDVAPTLLRLMGLEVPPEMEGHPLVEFDAVGTSSD